MAGEAQRAPARSRSQRRTDTLERLCTDVDLWIASASEDGHAYLVPLSYYWDGSTLTLATPRASRTARNLIRAGWVRAALGTTRDLVIIDDYFIPNDPSSREGVTSKLVIDATEKGSYPDISLPPKALLWKAYESWREAKLPDFERPARVERVLDYHAKRMQGGG